jgi:hypothetical protein
MKDINTFKTQNSDRILFVMCPFSCSEEPVRKLFEDRCYFLSAMGGALDLGDFNYAESVSALIADAEISQMVFVVQPTSPIIRNVLDRPNQALDLPGHKTLARVYSECAQLKHWMQMSTQQQTAVFCEHIAWYSGDQIWNHGLFITHLRNGLRIGKISYEALVAGEALKNLEIPEMHERRVAV